MSNIPPVVSFAELKTFLKIANIELPAGKNWDDVEFFFEREFWFPIPEHLTLQAAVIKSGQVIHVNFKYDCNKGEPVSVFILGKARPITFKNLPPYATVCGLKNALCSVLDDQIDFVTLRRRGDDTPLSDNFLLQRLPKGDPLIAETKVHTIETHSISHSHKTSQLWYALAILLCGLVVMWYYH